MRSLEAKPIAAWPTARRVLIVLPPAAVSGDLAAAFDALDCANRHVGADHFLPTVVSLYPSREVRLAGALKILAGAWYGALRPVRGDMLLILGRRCRASDWSRAFVRWLTRCSAEGCEIMTVGGGRTVKGPFGLNCEQRSGNLKSALVRLPGPVAKQASAVDAVLGLVKRDLGSRVAASVREMIAADRSDMAPPDHVVGARMDHRLANVLEYIDANLGGDLGTPVLAREATMSPRSLTRWFKRELGLTPRSYVQQRRVQKAVECLTTTDWSIKRISLSLGFQTPDTFRRAIRLHTGQTPTRLRCRLEKSPEF